jgi:hypothetical protein
VQALCPNYCREIRSKSLWQWYINRMISFLHIAHCHNFYLRWLLETGLHLFPQIKSLLCQAQLTELIPISGHQKQHKTNIWTKQDRNHLWELKRYTEPCRWDGTLTVMHNIPATVHLKTEAETIEQETGDRAQSLKCHLIKIMMMDNVQKIIILFRSLFIYDYTLTESTIFLSYNALSK